MSVQELSDENEDLSEQIKEFRRRTAMLRVLIEELEQSYLSLIILISLLIILNYNNYIN